MSNNVSYERCDHVENTPKPLISLYTEVPHWAAEISPRGFEMDVHEFRSMIAHVIRHVIGHNVTTRRAITTFLPALES